MARFRNTLNSVRVAAPCKADWDQMMGNERVRFCGECSLNVYNLSGMTRADAETLIARTEGRLCVRFYRRSDGSIITKDCPVGLRAIRRRMSSVAKAIGSSVMGLLAGLGVYGAVSTVTHLATPQRTMGVMVQDVKPPEEHWTQGDMVVPTERQTPEVTEVIGKPFVKPVGHRRNSREGGSGVSNR